ncbi:MAG: tetratricopeptide repeat-containing sensor histidine kinase [Phototrophicales bacterium]|nr:tetratricopeptide repeat-containing sensor histidine kinase [Phototrophicales bacterium]
MTGTTATAHIDKLITHARELRLRDVSGAIALSEEAYQLSTEGEFASAPYIKGQAGSLINLALCNAHLSNIPEALTQTLNARALFRVIADVQGEILALILLGGMNQDLGNYPYAQEVALEALSLAERTSDKRSQISAANIIGLVYLQTGNANEALKYFYKCLDLSAELGVKRSRGAVYINICQAYITQKQYSRAMLYALKALQHYREINYQQGEAEVLTEIGKIYEGLGNDIRALLVYVECLVEAQRSGNQRAESSALASLGRIHLRQNELPQALRLLNDALQLAEAVSAPQLLGEVHQTLANAYEKDGNFVQAVHHLKEYHRVHTDIFNENADTRLKNLQVLHQVETARQQAEIHQLKNIQLQEEINERQKAQEALTAANAQLQQEIKQREQLIDDLDAYTHTVAHDLKNPLSLINGYTSLILMYYATAMPDEAVEWMRAIEHTGDKMNTVITELLLLARIHQQSVDVLPLAMGEIIAEVYSQLIPKINEFDAKIALPEQYPLVLGHAPWIEQVWINYMSNAIKYGGRPPKIEIGVTPLPEVGMVKFWVRDNGDGLSQESQTQLFSPFKRFSEQKAEGHGVGLSIVKRIVEKLGGEVGVVSSGIAGEGSVFSFTLPAALEEIVVGSEG